MGKGIEEGIGGRVIALSWVADPRSHRTKQHEEIQGGRGGLCV